MKLRKTIKQIVALGTGVTMLGATIFGATAADLSSYPEPFLKDGVFAGAIVVGDSAKASDVVGAIDIATSLQADAVTESVVNTNGNSATVTVEGDAYKIAKSGNELNIGEALTEVVDTLTDNELDSLASGTFSNQKGSSTFNQFLRLGTDAAKVEYTDEESSDDNPRLALHFNKDETAYEYEVSFNPAIKSDIDDMGTASTSDDQLDDFDNKKLTILGKEYTILDTEIDEDTSIQVALMSGAIQDTLQEYTSKTYTLNDVDYEVEVVAISSEPDVILKVNGEVTDKLAEDDTYTLNDGTEIGIKTLLENEGSETGGGDIVEFYLGASKVTLSEDNTWTDPNWGDLEYQSDTVDATVDFDGSINSAKTEIELDGFTIQFNATDDYYLGAGEKLSEKLDSDEKGNLFMENIDFQYAGLEIGDAEETTITGNSDQVEMKVKVANGNAGSFYPFFINATNEVQFGEDSDSILITNASLPVAENEYVVLTTGTDSRIIQVDRVKDDELVLVDALTGKEVANPSLSGTNHKTITIDGHDYGITPGGDGTITFDDFGDDTDNNDANLAAFYTDEEAKIILGLNSGDGYIDFVEEEKDDNPADNDVGVFEIAVETDGADEIRLQEPADVGGITSYTANDAADPNFGLWKWDSDSDKYTGYSSYGTYFEYDTSSDENEVTINYPEGEASVAAYISSGVTSTSESVAVGDGQVVTQTVNPIAVGTAKLASEINLNNLGSQNLIVVGGPCVNAVAAKLMDNPQPCAQGFEEGKAIVKLYETSSSKMAMLVAGASALDTRRATRVLANYDEYSNQLQGMEVAIMGTSTTFSDTVVSAVVEEPVVEEPVAEEPAME